MPLIPLSLICREIRLLTMDLRERERVCVCVYDAVGHRVKGCLSDLKLLCLRCTLMLGC